MKEQEARARICSGLSKIYGMQEGIRMAGTVVPGIINDFHRMLQNKGTGEQVQEEYRLEDGRASVFVSGRVQKDGSPWYDVVQVKRS